MVPWRELRRVYEKGEAGMHLDEIRSFPEIFRDSEDYDLSENMLEMFT
jgi:hypothetical protein